MPFDTTYCGHYTRAITVVIAGVDEVGRGCIAGPVYAAAVILGDCQIEGLKDSKKLSAKKREQLAQQIQSRALCYAIKSVGVAEIETINILQATLSAMKQAVDALTEKPSVVLVDGNQLPQWRYNSRAIVGGDQLQAEIAAASIIAKVARDSFMCELQRQYPQYSFAQHKGYSTKQHCKELQENGICSVHRKTFSPVKQYI